MGLLSWTCRLVKVGEELHDHPSTKAEDLQTFLPIIEGRPFLERQSDGSVKPGASMGADGIAISLGWKASLLLPTWQPQIIQGRYKLTS